MTIILGGPHQQLTGYFWVVHWGPCIIGKTLSLLSCFCSQDYFCMAVGGESLRHFLWCSGLTTGCALRYHFYLGLETIFSTGNLKNLAEWKIKPNTISLSKMNGFHWQVVVCNTHRILPRTIIGIMILMPCPQLCWFMGYTTPSEAPR